MKRTHGRGRFPRVRRRGILAPAGDTEVAPGPLAPGPLAPPEVAGRGRSLSVALHLLTRSAAERVVDGRRDPDRGDLPWAEGYPLEGDARAAASYATHVGLRLGPEESSRYGYYQIVENGRVIGGIGFHGPPRGGVVEIGYGVVPSVRRRGVASAALRQILVQAAADPRIRSVVGRTTEDNLASQKVMLGTGMRYTGRDTDFLHYEIDVRSDIGVRSEIGGPPAGRGRRPSDGSLG